MCFNERQIKIVNYLYKICVHKPTKRIKHVLPHEKRNLLTFIESKKYILELGLISKKRKKRCEFTHMCETTHMVAFGAHTETKHFFSSL